nr:Rib/alpha-like domain-containing protein [Pseudoclavibacter sp. Marseille-Q3772]
MVSSQQSRPPGRGVKWKFVAGAATAASLAFAPGMLAQPSFAADRAWVGTDATTPVTRDDLRARGNDAVEVLYNGSNAPKPGDMNIWPTTDLSESLNVQSQPDMQTCAVTMMGGSESLPIATGESANLPNFTNVHREVAQATPEVARELYSEPNLPNGYIITRAATDADTDLTQSGRVKVTDADAGHLTLAMDGWGKPTFEKQSVAPDMGQSSRLRIATKEPVTDFRLVLRLDDKATLSEKTTSMANWNGWWAPGYTQAPSSNFAISYTTHNGVKYAVVEADTIPANSWATVTFEGRIAASDLATDGQAYAWSAATANFSTLHCEAPTPKWTPEPVQPGTEVTVANVGDEIPQGTLPKETEVTTDKAPENLNVTVDVTTGELKVAPTVDTKSGDYTFPVRITYGDGTHKDVDVTVRVLPTQTEGVDPKDQSLEVKPGAEASTPVVPFEDADGNPASAPEGTTFGPQGDVPSWVTVNPDGTVTAKPGEDVAPGEYPVEVLVTYPDGSTDVSKVTITVVPAQTEGVDPKDQSLEVKPGAEASTPVVPFEDADGNPASAPEGTTFGPQGDVPSWVTVNPDGTVTAKPGEDVAPGEYPVEVLVTYPDGSTDVSKVTITVVEPDAATPTADPTVTTEPIPTATSTQTSGAPDASTPTENGESSGLAATGGEGLTAIALLAGALMLASAVLLYLQRRDRCV